MAPMSELPEATETRSLPEATEAGARLLGNENRPSVKPDWNVRYFRPYQPVDLDQWRLTVEGLVEHPLSLSLETIADLPQVEGDIRMKCVECWSARGRWVGFTYATLAEMVRPLPEARAVIFECADGYYESLSTEGLSRLDVLFAHQMDGEPLLPEFGAPLRLAVPSKYGYKWPKAITRLRFEARERNGYWSDSGPYSADGRVQPGRDFPLDLQETREIDGGAITQY
jgi:DMSO/TMAO reductase YedYZ molybdopterin-dependent catalytic subunit